MDSWKTKYLFPAHGHDPDRPLRRRVERARRSTPPQRVLRPGRALRHLPRGHAVARRRAAQGPHRARPGWRCAPAARSSPSASSAPPRSSRPTRSCPKPFKTCSIRIGEPIDIERYRDRDGRPPRAAPAHRRGDVRDPRADGPGVRRHATRRRRPRRLPTDVGEGARRRADTTAARAALAPRLLDRPTSLTSRQGPQCRSARVTLTRWPMADQIDDPLPDGSTRSVAAGHHRPVISPRRSAVDLAQGRGRSPAVNGDRARPRLAAARTATRSRSSRPRPTGAATRSATRRRTSSPRPCSTCSRAPSSASGRPSRTASTTTSSCPTAARSRADDLERIEARMREIIARGPAVRPRRAAAPTRRRSVFADQQYKLEIIERHGRPTRCRQREAGLVRTSRPNPPRFVDLCRGPHVPHTGRLGHFKLHAGRRRLLAGRREEPDAAAHLRHGVGDRRRRSNEHLHRLEEAEKRDHRKLGVELDLFSFPEEIGGGPRRVPPEGRPSCAS